VESQGPKEWRESLWKLSEREKFQNPMWGDDKEWMTVYSVEYPDTIDLKAEDEIDQLAEKIWKWCAKEMKENSFQNAVDHIAKLLPSLKTFKKI
jgi:hypothetical protein